MNGYGVYVTRDMEAGESILGTPDGLGIIVGYHGDDRGPKYIAKRQFKDLFDAYWWNRGVPSHVTFETTPDVMDFQLGFGCLPNHHCVLEELTTTYPTAPYDDALANRFRDPSAGSFSYNRGREFRVKHRMEAGSELFLYVSNLQLYQPAGSPTSP